MKSNQIKQLIAILILFLALLALPIFSKVYYLAFYYAGITISMPITIFRIVWDEKFKEKFYKRWHKARQRGFLINVVREGLFSFFLITVLTSISQFFGNGLTPLDIMSKLSNSELLLLFAISLILSLIIGLVAQHENDKRYKQIYYSMKNSNS